MPKTHKNPSNRGIKYTKSTIRNQSIIQKYFSSLMDPKWWMSNQQVLKMVDFGKQVNYMSVDLHILEMYHKSLDCRDATSKGGTWNLSPKKKLSLDVK
jgi:hypothetical protein